MIDELKLAKTVARTLRLSAEDVKPETLFKDYVSWNSLKHMELVAAMEDAMGITFTAQEIARLVSLQAALELAVAHARE
jgi:acyl carrier protein